MFKTWSISSLLKLWAFATILAILVIAAVAVYASDLFSSSQNGLIEKVLPIENASRQINAVVSLFITRQKQVIVSRSVSSIENLIPREELENEFSIQWQQIAASVESKKDRETVDALNEYYRDFLVADSELMGLIIDKHTIRELLQDKAQQVVELEKNVHNKVEMMLGRIDLQRRLNIRGLAHTLNSNRSTQESKQQISKQYLIEKLSQLVRLNALQVSALTQKLMLTDNADGLLSIKDNNIKPYQTLLLTNIRLLKENVHNKTELLELTESLDTLVASLMTLVTEGDLAIYKLRLKQIRINSLLAEGQQKSISILEKVTIKLGTLVSIVKAKNLQTVKNSTQVVEQAQWLIIILSFCITFGMIWFITSIAKLINTPLGELSRAMNALSTGLFDTRLKVAAGGSEFDAIATDFNLFSENAQALIGDLAEAKNTLELREQYLSTVLNGVPEAVLTLSPEGIISSTNPAAEEVLKAGNETLTGLNISRFLAVEYQNISLDKICTILKENKELEGRDYNNQSFSMWLSLNYVSNSKQDTWVCVISDNTAWKKTEQNLKITSSELDAIFENAMVGIAFIKDRTVLRVNSKFEQLFAADRALVEGKSTKILYASDEIYEQIGDDAYAAMASGDSFVGEVRLIRQDGSLFWGMMSAKAADANDPQAGSIWLCEDISVQRENDEKLRMLASSDPLTGLPNRSVFNDRIEHAIHKAHRNSTRLAIFFLDLDHFKHINDSFGHKAGDILLCEVANRLKSCIREGDTVARLGGDEFTIILEEVRSAQHVGGVANKVMSAIVQPYTLEGIEVNISSSIGVSLYPADGRDVDTLLRNADAAMYHAKNTGRNNFQFYSGEMNAQAAKRLAMETSLRRAIENDEFYLHFQPQIDIQTGSITGAEALLRWNNDKWGEVSPAEFVPILEDAGLITAVGQTVIKQAIDAYLTLKDKLDPAFRVAVNLSGRQFQGGQLASFIEDQLAITGMSAKNLELEITESVLMDDTDLAITTLNSLSGVGITLAIDDFGTGYSSLSYLKRFPLNVLKIDSSFVRDVNIDEDDAAIVMAILAMSHRLNLEVIAEGVETAEQLSFLADNDCDRVQGYFFSKPLSLENFSRFIDDNPTVSMAR
jgi:diguanylate cyclase (GGDEF)-like protein/PAS domain S-box-containing protein